MEQSSLSHLEGLVEFANYQQFTNSKLYPENICIVVIDEAHHGLCETQRSLIEYYKNQQCYIIGLSATHYRSSDAETTQLHSLFDRNLIVGPTIEQLTISNHLVPAQFYLKTGGLDESSSKRGDSDTLDGLKESVSNILDVKFINGRRGIVFCNSVNEAQDLCLFLNILFAGKQTSNSSGSKNNNQIAACVLGGIDATQRKVILENFHNNDNKLTILITCSALIEGFSESLVEWIVVAKNVYSKNQIVQMVGRGLRLPGASDPRRINKRKSCLRMIFLKPVHEDILNSFYPKSGFKKTLPKNHFKITLTEDGMEDGTSAVNNIERDELHGLMHGYERYMPRLNRSVISSSYQIFNLSGEKSHLLSEGKRKSPDSPPKHSKKSRLLL